MAKRGRDGPEMPGEFEPLPLEDLTPREKYPPAVRLALIIGLPLALWALIGAGALWLAGSLWGRVVGIIVLAAIAVLGILVASSQRSPKRTGRGDRAL